MVAGDQIAGCVERILSVGKLIGRGNGNVVDQRAVREIAEVDQADNLILIIWIDQDIARVEVVVDYLPTQLWQERCRVLLVALEKYLDPPSRSGLVSQRIIAPI